MEKGDQKVGSVINAWGLLESAMKAIGRNRRASKSLSPTLAMFAPPHGKLYLKMHLVLSQ